MLLVHPADKAFLVESMSAWCLEETGCLSAFSNAKGLNTNAALLAFKKVFLYSFFHLSLVTEFHLPDLSLDVFRDQDLEVLFVFGADGSSDFLAEGLLVLVVTLHKGDSG